MIVSTQEIFDGWITIMKRYSKGELSSQEEATTKKGRQPSPATFHCLMGLKDGDILTLQANDGHILFLKKQMGQRGCH